MKNNVLNENILAALVDIQNYLPPIPKTIENYNTDYKHILLTGANGYLGIHLIAELLSNTNAIIYCGIRGNTIAQAKQKLNDNFKRYDLSQLIDNNRLEIILIDLAQPNIGLDEEKWQYLCRVVDAIYHNGAYVHHLQTYKRMAPTNVKSTETIINLASTHKLKRIHFISSKYSAFNSFSKLAKEGEPTISPIHQALAFGYATTKWSAEWMLWHAQYNGIPIDIYRLGQITGHSISGRNNFEKNNLTHLILGIIQMGYAPVLLGAEEMLPVDYVARSIIALSRLPYKHANGWNVVNNKQLTYEELFHLVCDIGYPIKLIENNLWRKKLRKITEDNLLYPLIKYYDTENPVEFIQVECDITQKTLNSIGIYFPKDYTKLLSLYLNFWKNENVCSQL